MDSNQSPKTLKVVGWILSFSSVAVIIIRFSTKLVVTKKWSIDDNMISLALAFSIAQSALLTVAADYGLGSLATIEDGAQLRQLQKFVYAANIMYLLGMCFGMLATSQLILNLSPDRKHRTISWTVTSASIVWAVMSVFGFAFQCQLPTPWNLEGQCIDQRAFYTFIICVNILIELGLILQPGLVVWKLKLPAFQRLIIVACFFSRSFVIIALLGSIVTAWNSTSKDSVLSYGFIICTILADNFSVMAANMPYLRPFLQALEHGGTRVDMMTPWYGRSVSASHMKSSKLSYGLRSKTQKSQTVSSVIPRHQSINDTAEWKFEQIEESSTAHPMENLDDRKYIVQTSEYTVESHSA